MCFEKNIEKITKRIGYCLAVHQIIKNSNVFEPPQYYKNVWLL